jgi:hypothetical protein
VTQVEGMYLMGCYAYVHGFDEGVGLVSTAPYCAPQEVANGQMVRILMKFIRDNPAKAHLSTGLLFLEAMKGAFPCPTGK